MCVCYLSSAVWVVPDLILIICVLASWVFLPSEHESSVPTGDVAARFLIYESLAVHPVIVVLFSLIVSHLYNRYVLA